MNSLFSISDKEKLSFVNDGFVLVKGMFNAEETTLLLESAKQDQILQEKAYAVKDGDGKSSKLSLWNHPGEDVWGMVSRSNRIAGSMEKLLGGEVYHYHSKLMLKEPKEGGAWEWHQDYGYWYKNGCLYPHMASCLIALDKADKENGCLQVIKGSHHMGRIEHGTTGAQTGADEDRVNEILKVLPLVYCELDPGDALFFHSNLLHRSDANKSDRSRWSLICCYNMAMNNPVIEHHHPQYTPLEKVPDSALLETGMKLTSDGSSYLNPDHDSTIEHK